MSQKLIHINYQLQILCWALNNIFVKLCIRQDPPCTNLPNVSVIRCHGSDVYLGMSQLLSNVLACVGKSSETIANWNN